MNKFKLNQRVYCKYHKKYGIIKDIDTNNSILRSYPIAVEFDDSIDTYTKDGRWYRKDSVVLISLEDKINKLLKL